MLSKLSRESYFPSGIVYSFANFCKTIQVAGFPCAAGEKSICMPLGGSLSLEGIHREEGLLLSAVPRTASEGLTFQWHSMVFADLISKYTG